MTKISLLPEVAAQSLDGNETIPFVKNGVMSRARLSSLVSWLALPFVEKAQAWAQSNAAPDPMDPASKSAKTHAAEAKAAMAPLARVVRTGGGRGLYEVKRLLSDPLCQFVGIVLIGDSITWGMTVPEGGPIEPRSGNLSDMRNNATSPTWANLLHAYLGREYYSGGPVEASAWPGSAGGHAIFTYRRPVNLFPYGGDFEVTNDAPFGVPTAWEVVYNPSGYVGGYVTIAIDNSQDNARISFPFTGFKFKLAFAALLDGADYELHVNGVLKGTFSTSTEDPSVGGPVRFSAIREHDLGEFVKDAKISIRVIPGNNARRIFRAEAIIVERVLRVTNQGIIGSDTVGWYNRLLTNATQEGDSVALVQLGTNDRYLAPTTYGIPNGPAMFRRYLEAIVQVLESRRITPILACANAVGTESGYLTMSDVRGVIATCADARGYDFVDHYALTAAQMAKGQNGTADNLHPGEVWHDDMFQGLRYAIERSMSG